MHPILRRMLPYLTVALAAVAIYDGVTFYMRWRDVRQGQEREAAREAANAKKTIDALGGNALKILTFYATPGTVRAGESASMCYGVNAATKLTITPDVGTSVYPAYSRCFQVAPGKSTDYTLTAEDASGKNVTATVKLTVIH